MHRFAATIAIDGGPHDPIAIVREHNNDRFHYDLSRDRRDEVRYRREADNAVRPADEQVRSTALEGDPVDVNLVADRDGVNETPPNGWGEADAGGTVASLITDDDMRALRGRLDDLGLSRVALRLERDLRSRDTAEVSGIVPVGVYRQ